MQIRSLSLSAARFLLNLGTPVPAWRQSTLEGIISHFHLLTISIHSHLPHVHLGWNAKKWCLPMPFILGFFTFIPWPYPLLCFASSNPWWFIHDSQMHPLESVLSSGSASSLWNAKDVNTQHLSILRQILLQADPRHWKPRTVHSWFVWFVVQIGVNQKLTEETHVENKTIKHPTQNYERIQSCFWTIKVEILWNPSKHQAHLQNVSRFMPDRSTWRASLLHLS